MGQPARDHHDHDHDDADVHHRRRLTVWPSVEDALAAAKRDSTNAFNEIDDNAQQVRPAEGPLQGMPLGVKDIIDHAGHVTTAGSKFYRHEATRTAPALSRLESAGAVVIGRTGLHEFAFGFSSENPWFGPVANPWDLSLSPGGSSGGSGAAVAAGVVPAAVGTDTGGSVRVPAALCAVSGLKTTHGLIPLDGVFPLVASFDTVGTIARSLDDLEAITAVMAGDRWQDAEQPIERLLVPEAWLAAAPLDHEVAGAFESFLSAAADAGLEVETAELPLLQPSRLQRALIGKEIAEVHRRWREDGMPYGSDVGDRIDAALAMADDPTAQAEALRWRDEITRQMESATAGATAVVTPTVAGMDKTIGVEMMGDHHYRPVLSWFTAPVNPTGHPALSMPAAGPGRGPSIQMVGARWSEAALVDLARRLENRGVLAVPRLPSG